MTDGSTPAAAETARTSSRRGAFVRAVRMPAAVLAAIAAGAIVRLFPIADAHRAGDWVWIGALVALGTPVVWRGIAEALKGQFATDLVATLAIIGAVALDQPLAGLVVLLMQTGGEALESYAAARATDAIRLLEANAPRIAHRMRAVSEAGVAFEVNDIPVEAIGVGDRLLVRPGELIPCDGTVIDGRADVDVSRITGEPLPLRAGKGTHLLSGSAVMDAPLTITATAPASESQYARIVELVREAQRSKAPLQRLADRYATWFTPLTILVCAIAYVATRDPVRILAVLVVATPCPLILATPVAILGGINRAAKRQIIVRHGGALEQLARVDTAVFDKTGTLTIGQPAVRNVAAQPGFTDHDVLRLAGAVEHGSGHLLARSVVTAAVHHTGKLPTASEHEETAGRGISGIVEGKRVGVGSRSYVLERYPAVETALAREQADGLRAYVAIDGALAGRIEFADAERPELAQMLTDLASLGVRRTVLLSGDHEPNVRALATRMGIAEAHGDLLPDDKVAFVRGAERAGARVMMVGDGVNDAPALSSATVGMALAGHGGGIAAESADVVILADELDRIPESIVIGRRAIAVAKQSIYVGLGLSALAMVFASAGYIVPTVGAVLQEVIDLAVILNALRAGSVPNSPAPSSAAATPAAALRPAAPSAATATDAAVAVPPSVVSPTAVSRPVVSKL